MIKTPAFPIISKQIYWYILSTVLILPGVVSLITNGLNIGIDFKGGTVLQARFEEGRPAIEEIRDRVGESNVPAASVQTSGEEDVLIRYPNTEGRDARSDATSILSKLQEVNPENTVSEQRFETIGGSVAGETTRRALTAVILTSIAIILFIAWSFSSVPKPASSWRFGVTAVLALLHDLLFVIGSFSLIGYFFPQVEVDALFITALLTILGFSVNDTIVVFDRIRENLRRRPTLPFDQIANESVNETLARSINTSFTVLIVLVALLLLGGEPIRNFILALTLGVAVGTYSSIFNAAPLLVSWQNWRQRGSDSTKK